MNDGSTPEVNGASVESSDLLAHAVTRTNQYVCHTHESALFATLFIGLLDPLTGTVHYINAGHNPPRVLRRDGDRCDLDPTGPLVGMVEGAKYAAAVIELGLGDVLFIYSDGVEDTTNGIGEFYGRERMLKLLALPANSATEYVERLSDGLTTFMGGAKPFDDVTVLAIMRHFDG
jgi:sigma-B regulation protein RsbU (phosphoserine phosphatase)